MDNGFKSWEKGTIAQQGKTLKELEVLNKVEPKPTQKRFYIPDLPAGKLHDGTFYVFGKPETTTNIQLTQDAGKKVSSTTRVETIRKSGQNFSKLKPKHAYEISRKHFDPTPENYKQEFLTSTPLQILGKIAVNNSKNLNTPTFNLPNTISEHKLTKDLQKYEAGKRRFELFKTLGEVARSKKAPKNFMDENSFYAKLETFSNISSCYKDLINNTAVLLTNIQLLQANTDTGLPSTFFKISLPEHFLELAGNKDIDHPKKDKPLGFFSYSDARKTVNGLKKYLEKDTENQAESLPFPVLDMLGMLNWRIILSEIKEFDPYCIYPDNKNTSNLADAVVLRKSLEGLEFSEMNVAMATATYLMDRIPLTELFSNAEDCMHENYQQNKENKALDPFDKNHSLPRVSAVEILNEDVHAYAADIANNLAEQYNDNAIGTQHSPDVIYRLTIDLIQMIGYFQIANVTTNNAYLTLRTYAIRKDEYHLHHFSAAKTEEAVQHSCYRSLQLDKQILSKAKMILEVFEHIMFEYYHEQRYGEINFEVLEELHRKHQLHLSNPKRHKKPNPEIYIYAERDEGSQIINEPIGYRWAIPDTQYTEEDAKQFTNALKNGSPTNSEFLNKIPRPESHMRKLEEQRLENTINYLKELAQGGNKKAETYLEELTAVPNYNYQIFYIKYQINWQELQ